jgi:hypothetical protein
VAPSTAPAARSGSTPATATGLGSGDTRVGTIELALPRLRSGSYFPEWLLERRKRAEKAMISVIAISYLLGVSTRRMEKLVEQLGITRLSKSQVSVMAKELDEHVESFRTRPLDAGPYTFIAADALTMRVREGGRVGGQPGADRHRVNADGHREILGVELASAESAAGWLKLFGGLGRPRPVRGRAGHQRRAHRARGGDARHPRRCHLAAVPYPLRGQPDAGLPEGQLGMGQGDAALDLRPARRPGCPRPVRPRRRDPDRETPRARRPPP